MYDIRYSRDHINDSNWDDAWRARDEPVPLPTGNIQYFDQSGLRSATTYYFRMKVCNSPWSDLSNEFMVVTNNCTCCYQEAFHQWTANTADTWEMKDLWSDFGIPGYAVCEIAIENRCTFSSRDGGVRPVPLSSS